MKPEDENSPDSLSRQGLAGHSPALARLFLVGLRPRRARLRFTGQHHYRTGGKEVFQNPTRRKREENNGCIGPSLGKRPSQTQSQSECPRGLGLRSPSVVLIETAGVCETVAAEYSVSGPRWSDRLPFSADGFTKGWIGVPPHEKRTARTTSLPMTATTTFPSRYLRQTQTTRNKPYRA